MIVPLSYLDGIAHDVSQARQSGTVCINTITLRFPTDITALAVHSVAVICGRIHEHAGVLALLQLNIARHRQRAIIGRAAVTIDYV